MKISKQTTLNAYILHQEEYIKRYSKFPPRNQDIDRAFNYSWDKKYSDLQILELWCCAGREYSYISQLSKNYLGIDIQDKTIAFAKNKYGSEKFICWNFEETDFPSNQDIVFAFASLLHFDKQAMISILKKIHNSLSSEWIVYISLKRSNTYEIYTESKTERVFYLYSLSEFETISSVNFDTIYSDENTYNNQDWFTIILRRK